MRNREAVAVILFTVGPVAWLAAPAAVAQTEADPCSAVSIAFRQPPFEAFDTDGDGLIGDSEASGCETLATLFETLDLDASGTLSPAEYRSFAMLWEQRAQTFGADAD